MSWYLSAKGQQTIDGFLAEFAQKPVIAERYYEEAVSSYTFGEANDTESYLTLGRSSSKNGGSFLLALNADCFDWSEPWNPDFE